MRMDEWMQVDDTFVTDCTIVAGVINNPRSMSYPDPGPGNKKATQASRLGSFHTLAGCGPDGIDPAYAYRPQSRADGSSIIEKSHTSMPISIVTGMSSPSTALALVISIMAGP